MKYLGSQNSYYMDWTLEVNGEKREALLNDKYDELYEFFEAYLIIRLFHSCKTILVGAVKEKCILSFLDALLSACRLVSSLNNPAALALRVVLRIHVWALRMVSATTNACPVFSICSKKSAPTETPKFEDIPCNVHDYDMG